MSELPQRLREAAAAHRPDRERMLARMERATGAPGQPRRAGRPERRRAPWARTTVVAAAAAGVIGIGSLAVAVVAGDGGPGRTAVTPGSSAALRPPPATGGLPVPAAGRRGGPQAHRDAHRDAGPRGGQLTGVPGAPGRPAAPSSLAPPTATGSASGASLWSDPASASAPRNSALGQAGSRDTGGSAFRTPSNADLAARQSLTALTVEVQAAGTCGAAGNAGAAGTGSCSPVRGRTTAPVDERG